MPDPNSVSVSVAATTVTVISAPGVCTTLSPQPPYSLGFIRVLGLDLTGTTTGVVTLTSSGGSFPDRVLDTIQVGPGGGIAQSPTSPGSGGKYDCDPGAALKVTNTAGTVTGSIRYTIMGVG